MRETPGETDELVFVEGDQKLRMAPVAMLGATGIFNGSCGSRMVPGGPRVLIEAPTNVPSGSGNNSRDGSFRLYIETSKEFPSISIVFEAGVVGTAAVP